MKSFARVLAVAALAWTATESHSREPKAANAKFPGFEVTLPLGEVVVDENNPVAGEHVRVIDRRELDGLDHVLEPVTHVTWAPDVMRYSDWRDTILPSIVAAHSEPPRIARVLKQTKLDDSRWLAVYGKGNEVHGSGVVICGTALTVLVGLDLHVNADRQEAALRAIVESVKCTAKTARAKPQAAVKLPAGFGRDTGSPDQAYLSLRGESLTITIGLSEGFENLDNWREVTHAMMETQFGKKIPAIAIRHLETERADLRPVHLTRYDVPGRPAGTYLGAIHCDREKLTFIAMIGMPKANDAHAETMLSWVGCPGDETREPPAFRDVAQKACRAGDAPACAFAP